MISFNRIMLCTLVSSFCFLLLVILKRNEPTAIFYVHTPPTMYELSRILQEQKNQIDSILNHPRLIHHCSEDESTIKYPRQASDELTDITMGTNDDCSDLNSNAVIIVHSTAPHFDRRGRLRDTYGNYNITKPYRLKIVFLIGSVLDAYLQIKLEEENREYMDTVVGVFLDVYQNLTLKAVMGFRWLTQTCPDAKLIIKMDDDVFFNVDQFFTRYWNTIPATSKRTSIHCSLWHNATVSRTGKWKVEESLFANASYPFPYCSGYFIVITPDLIKPMYLYGRSIDFFWIGDVHVYGMVPAAIGGVHFYQLGGKERRVTDSYKDYKKCVKREYCPTWAVLTSGTSEFDTELISLTTRFKN